MPHIFEPAVESLEKVPAPFHPFYKKDEAQGKFVMDPDIFGHLDNSGLRKALDTERTNAKEFGKIKDAWTKVGESPEAVLTKLQELQEAVTKKDGSAGAFEKYKQEVDALMKQKDLDNSAKLTKMQATLETYLVEAEAAKIIADAKGSPALLMPHIKGCAKVVEENGKYVVRVVDAEGEPRYAAATGAHMTLSDLVGELKAHAEFGKAFEPSGTQGGGMRPGSSGSPRSTVMDPSKLSSVDKIAAGLNQQTR